VKIPKKISLEVKSLLGYKKTKKTIEDDQDEDYEYERKKKEENK